MRPARPRSAAVTLALATMARGAGSLPGRADPGDRQAGRACRCTRAGRRRSISSSISTRCASACPSRLRWPIGSTATPAAAWCSGGTARRWPAGPAVRRRPGREGLLGGGPGAPPQAGRPVDLALRKRYEHRGWWMEVDPAGQAARTDYRILGEAEGLTLAGMPAAHRPHPPDPGSLRGPRLPGAGRSDLRRASCGSRQAAAAPPRARPIGCRSIPTGRRSQSPHRRRRICWRCSGVAAIVRIFTRLPARASPMTKRGTNHAQPDHQPGRRRRRRLARGQHHEGATDSGRRQPDHRQRDPRPHRRLRRRRHAVADRLRQPGPDRQPDRCRARRDRGDLRRRLLKKR